MTTLTLEAPAAKTIYSVEQLQSLDPNKVPKHIAIIMDGNRRWAANQGMPLMMGHWEGAEALIEVVRGAHELGVKTLTVYAFSTENWVRPEKEIEALMNIFELYLVRKRETLIRDGVRVDAIGNISALPQKVQEAFYETKKATEHCDRINLVLAMNYGGRDELRRAVSKIVDEKIPSVEITEKLISRYLDTNAWGDPDLLIRTSGELRVSNFLLWQICYAEIYVTDVLWPNFSPKHLFDAVAAFQKRSRRLGGGIHERS